MDSSSGSCGGGGDRHIHLAFCLQFRVTRTGTPLPSLKCPSLTPFWIFGVSFWSRMFRQLLWWIPLRWTRYYIFIQLFIYSLIDIFGANIYHKQPCKGRNWIDLFCWKGLKCPMILSIAWSEFLRFLYIEKWSPQSSWSVGFFAYFLVQRPFKPSHNNHNLINI